jgi:hypothetical protein
VGQRGRTGNCRRDLDRWQTYQPMLWILVAMFFISGIFYSLLGRPWAQPKLA